jgi:hypothetical protein
MVYSPAVDALPDAARTALYARMREILHARRDEAVMQILDDTRPGWRQ